MTDASLIEKLEAAKGDVGYNGTQGEVKWYRNGLSSAIAIVRQHQAAPSEDVVERVAVALCLYVDGRRRSSHTEEIWLGLSETLKNAYRDQAEAAIAAMNYAGSDRKSAEGSVPPPAPLTPASYASLLEAMAEAGFNAGYLNNEHRSAQWKEQAEQTRSHWARVMGAALDAVLTQLGLEVK